MREERGQPQHGPGVSFAARGANSLHNLDVRIPGLATLRRAFPFGQSCLRIRLCSRDLPRPSQRKGIPGPSTRGRLIYHKV